MSRSFSGSSSGGGSFGRSGSFGSRSFTGTSTNGGARLGSSGIVSPPVIPPTATMRSFNFGGSSYRSYSYGGWSDYSYAWSPWGRPAWYYYTPFHPAFYYGSPYYYGGYYRPGGFSFFRLLIGLVVFGVIIALIAKLFRGARGATY